MVTVSLATWMIFCVVLAILAAFPFLALGFLLLMSDDDDDEFPPYKKKVFKYSIFVFVFGITIGDIHSFYTRTFLIIYGVGGTIDYVKENKDAKEIFQDKCIKALDKYLNDVLKEDKE